MKDDYSIHFHVWDIEAMFEMISGARSEFRINFRIKSFLSSGDEAVFILEKCRAISSEILRFVRFERGAGLARISRSLTAA
jgi:hypothetical protein